MNKDTLERIKTYPNFRQCSIQTFNDQDKAEHSQLRILPMTDENLEKCVKLQDMLPYGIYFSVNPMESGKRNRESVKFIQTWICDIDSGTKEEQLKLINDSPLKPSLVVESVHGFHLYYLSDNNLTEEQFSDGNLGIRNYYNGDIKVCKDTARVLRIPGYYHMKEEKVMVTFRDDLSCGMLYSVEEIYKAFPNQMEIAPKVLQERVKPTLNLENNFWRNAGELDNKSMLEELSGTSWVNGETYTFKRNSGGTEQIRCNGKSTGCWIDKNGMIGSGDKGGPTWIQWLKWYKDINWKELAKYLKDHHPEIEERKVAKINTEELIYKPTVVPKLEKPNFTWGEIGLDDHLGKLKRGQLVILLGETGAGKTTFATFMARQNKGCCYYVLEDKVENIAMRYAMKRAGITKHEYNEGIWSKEKEMLYERAYLDFRNRDITMVDIGQKIQVETLMESMKEMKAKGCGLFFIDNLGFITAKGQSEAEQTAEISHQLVSFCMEQNVCVVLLHHFKKGKAGDRDISQMRGSGKLGDDAFVVVKYIRDDPQTFIQVYKDRTWGELETYEIVYDRGNYIYKGIAL